MGKYSSKKLRAGPKHNTALGRTVSDAEEGAVANGLSPVEGGSARHEANPEATLNGSRQADSEGLQGNKLELDSSMGNGPVSHRSLASSGSAAAREAASASQKTLGGTNFSAKSFGSSGRVWVPYRAWQSCWDRKGKTGMDCRWEKLTGSPKLEGYDNGDSRGCCSHVPGGIEEGGGALGRGFLCCLALRAKNRVTLVKLVKLLGLYSGAW